MERVIQVFDSFEEAEEANDRYYASLTPQERLNLVLELVAQHREALGVGHEIEPVCRVVDLHES
jgi:hypothetical protein